MTAKRTKPAKGDTGFVLPPRGIAGTRTEPAIPPPALPPVPSTPTQKLLAAFLASRDGCDWVGTEAELAEEFAKHGKTGGKPFAAIAGEMLFARGHGYDLEFVLWRDARRVEFRRLR